MRQIERKLFIYYPLMRLIIAPNYLFVRNTKRFTRRDSKINLQRIHNKAINILKEIEREVMSVKSIVLVSFCILNPILQSVAFKWQFNNFFFDCGSDKAVPEITLKDLSFLLFAARLSGLPSTCEELTLDCSQVKSRNLLNFKNVQCEIVNHTMWMTKDLWSISCQIRVR